MVKNRRVEIALVVRFIAESATETLVRFRRKHRPIQRLVAAPAALTE